MHESCRHGVWVRESCAYRGKVKLKLACKKVVDTVCAGEMERCVYGK